MNKLVKKTFLFFCCISMLHISINAQNEISAFRLPEIDVLRYSELDWQGSARFMGAGKAFGAVGAEFSALNLNPAAIGLYKKSEVTFTPLTISVYKNSSDYNNDLSVMPKVKYNIGSAGIVLALPGISNTPWKNIQLGFGYNRIKNFNNMFSIYGRNNGKTIGSYFANIAEGLNYNDVTNPGIWPSELWAAWESYLIDPVAGSETSYIAAMKDVDMAHYYEITQKGGIDEMIFSVGTNYNDKLFLGATIGVPFINFTQERHFYEKNDRFSSNYEFQFYEMNDNLTVRATGINLKLGVIYQPVDFLRVGAAFHTPTHYGNVRDKFDRDITIKWREFKGNGFAEYSDYEEYGDARPIRYALTTPLRAMVNMAFFIQQRAFISAEYEFTDYSMAAVYSGHQRFGEKNKEIQTRYGFSHIARVGAELSLNQVFAIRAGYNYVSSPYKDDTDGSKHYASLGFGFRTKYFYSDFAYALTFLKENYRMYNTAFLNPAKNQFMAHRIVLTAGVRF